MKDNIVDVDCPYCDAFFKVYYDMDKPYKIEYCSFCGEYLDDGDMNIEDCEIDEI